MEVLCLRTGTGYLVPMGQSESDKLSKVKPGDVVRADIVRVRNPAFHRKFFALLQFAFGIWAESCPPRVHKGVQIKPNFERFRKDLTILCGFYEPTFNVRNEMRLEAKSISFSSMTEDEFEALYSKAIDVVLEKILTRPDLTAEAVRQAVDNLMRFD